MANEMHYRSGTVERRNRGLGDLAADTNRSMGVSITLATTGGTPSTRTEIPPSFFAPKSKPKKWRPTSAGARMRKPRSKSPLPSDEGDVGSDDGSRPSKAASKNGQVSFFKPTRGQTTKQRARSASPDSCGSDDENNASDSDDDGNYARPTGRASGPWRQPVSSLAMRAVSPSSMPAISPRQSVSPREEKGSDRDAIVRSLSPDDGLSGLGAEGTPKRMAQSAIFGEGTATNEPLKSNLYSKTFLPRKPKRPLSTGKKKRLKGRRRKPKQVDGHHYYDSRKRPFKIREYQPHTMYFSGGGYLYDQGKPTEYKVYELKKENPGETDESGTPRSRPSTANSSRKTSRPGTASTRVGEPVTVVLTPRQKQKQKGPGNSWQRAFNRHQRFHEGAAIVIEKFKKKPHPRGARGVQEDFEAQLKPKKRLPFAPPEKPVLWSGNGVVAPPPK